MRLLELACCQACSLHVVCSPYSGRSDACGAMNAWLWTASINCESFGAWHQGIHNSVCR